MQISIQRERTGAANAERKQARNVEQIGLITGLAKVGASCVVGHELDGAKPVGKMDRKDRDEEYDDHGRRSEGHEGAKENQQSADNLDGNRRPAYKSAKGMPMACRIALNASAPR